MKLPIDVTELQFMAAVPPVPVVDFETKQPKADEDGQPLHSVQLTAVQDGRADSIVVKFAGAPGLMSMGTPVKVTGLVAIPWSKGDRSGVSFRAASVEAAVPVGRNGSSEEKAGRS